MLNRDPKKRPSINELLKTPLLMKYVKGFLDDDTFTDEFSHTVLHNQNIFSKKPQPAGEDKRLKRVESQAQHKPEPVSTPRVQKNPSMNPLVNNLNAK